MTNYVGFINSMLELRSQRLKEAQLREAGKREDMEGIAKGISSLGGSIKDTITQSNQDRVANSIMNERANIPRAQAVDSSIQAGADARAANMPGFHTGGLDELKMQKMVSEMDSTERRDMMMQQRLDQAAKYQDTMADYRRTQQAANAFNKQDEKPLKAFNASMAYYKNLRLATDAASKATDIDQYQNATDTVLGLHQSAKAAGLDVTAPDIPVFAPYQEEIEKQQKVLSGMEDQLKGMKSDWIPNLTGGDEAQQARIDEQRKMIEGLPGYGAQKPTVDTVANNGYMGGSQAKTTGTSAPVGGYSSPGEVKAAMDAGKISREEAGNILRNKFGFK